MNRSFAIVIMCLAFLTCTADQTSDKNGMVCDKDERCQSHNQCCVDKLCHNCGAANEWLAYNVIIVNDTPLMTSSAGETYHHVPEFCPPTPLKENRRQGGLWVMIHDRLKECKWLEGFNKQYHATHCPPYQKCEVCQPIPAPDRYPQWSPF